jgi:proton-dependent oligopeptide transporter, POT family
VERVVNPARKIFKEVESIMATNTDVAPALRTGADLDKHPKGLYALFATEMWERFSFYSMLALFTLYMQDGKEGFSWTPAQATGLYANYLMFVYASPLIGGWLADKKLGYRKAVMIGGLFFIAGHALLAVPTIWAVYAALSCLVIGNGFFKPNVSTMVGNLYPEGSKLKDRAYNIFYMGINVGAATAPIVMEIVKSKFGFHPAFTVAAFGMLVSVAILWKYKNIVEDPEALKSRQAGKPVKQEGIAANAVDNVADWKRITALIVIFAIVIVFWMIFHQNGSTLTYWADDNTDWNVTGIISNSINPAWIVALTFPLVWFWKWLSNRGMEPSTPTKIAIGMLLTGVSFTIMYAAAKSGEAKEVRPDMYATGTYRITDRSLDFLRADGVPEDVLQKLATAKDADNKFIVKDRKFAADEKGSGMQNFSEALGKVLTPAQASQTQSALLNRAFIFKVSPFWLILAYAVISLGELMLSPMGLSLVSKVAPLRVRGLMMGGWFVATAIGNKLTAIGVFWTVWKQSSFFIILACMAFVMSVVLALLLKPLKKAMPGV